MTAFDCDVVIIGAGFAGAAAACVLAQEGHRPIIVEANGRAGGRAYSRPMALGGEAVEFGGGWITPVQKRIRHYGLLAGVDLKPRQRVTERRYHDGSAAADGPPDATSLARIAADALSWAAGDFDAAGMSFARYLDSIAEQPALRAEALAWWTISGAGDPASVSVAEFFSSCSHGDGRLETMMEKLQHSIAQGASVLVERMIAHSGAKLKLGAAATRVHQFGSGSVSVTLVDGGQLKARACAVCVPLNVLPSISFAPALSARKTRAANIGHGGRALKLLIKARGVPHGVLSTGGMAGLQWLFAERMDEDGAVVIVAFGIDDGSFDPADRHQVSAQIRRHFPDAALIGWDWHDWNRDPNSRGTWVALPAGAPWIADADVWQAEDRIAFATSDIATEHAGWFEGAIISGEAAAKTLSARLKKSL